MSELVDAMRRAAGVPAGAISQADGDAPYPDAQELATAHALKHLLPQDAAKRKGLPICTGVFDYFPRALAYVSMVSKVGNDQHNPGQPLHWAKEKSTDHPDCIGRHLIERGTRDGLDNLRHSGKMAWRSLALLELELEAAEKAGESW